MFVVKVCLRLATLLLQLVLSDLLVENMIEEFVQILLCQLIVEFTTMRLNNVASARRGAVCQSVILRQLYSVLKHLFMFYCRILKRD